MREVYDYDFKGWQLTLKKYLGLERITNDSYEFKWGYFSPKFGFSLLFNRGGYFDSRTSFDICLGWGHFNIKFPYKTKLEKGCDLPRYGVTIHNDTFWIYRGGKFDSYIGQTDSKCTTFYLPWFNLEHDNEFHCVQTPDGTWEKETDYDAPNAQKLQIPFVYTLRNGDEQFRIATCYKERRRWHRKWFRFLPAAITEYKVNISFSDEVGERSGSWKGGVTGTSASLEYPEEPMETAFNRFISEKDL